MVNLYMDLQLYGKRKEHFTVAIHDGGERCMTIYINENFIIPSPLLPEDVDGTDFWYQASQGLDLNKLRKLGRRLCRLRKEIYHIPLMRSCSLNGEGRPLGGATFKGFSLRVL